ncbi:TDP-N-acetylfucosamine:lipid II N-acetylfucosaminyltransferase [Psychroflexus halocasei]|uniref:4-alpha-L-fucosyltransferase glycosyl transferase group 56 n=1 Tax=Psychroflexus halocasei TaxID=908615 RepID=A0A1H4DB42_9FLAO|nr:TDP-N-acetylfucosamine:lipid II N-acetylfucosaminyltransferase [Psychroflexus halocasei]SEA70013.1 4-alpha-L-fucosyltransferase glycosyl transferase group 56 [Psychroflexus halocasei]
MKILHICNDEKFINAANNTFEKIYPQDNLFLILHPNDKKLTHVKLKENTKTFLPETIEDFSETISKADVVFFHSYIPIMKVVFRYISRTSKLIWFCFGMEVYNDPKLYSRKKLLDKRTLSLFPPQKRPFKKELKDSLRPYVRNFKRDLPLSRIEKKLLNLRKMDYIAAVYQEEFDFVKSRLKSDAEWLRFCYFSLEYMVDLNDQVINNKKQHYFIGNSGHISNNHIDVFASINSLANIKSSVIVPLGYGNKQYIDMVTKEGFETFDENFKPILSFLPLKKYNEYLQTTKIAIFNARRQQGVGTIIPVIWHGAKVFLSKRNTFYHYLKRIGILVYCYETELNKENLKDGLSIAEIEHNREILYQELNEKHLLKELKEQLDFILENQQIHPE